jgi:hypothetical protein
VADAQTILGNAGAKLIADYNGGKYPLEFRTQWMHAEFERLVKERAKHKLKTDFADMPKNLLDKKWEELFEDFDSPDPKTNYSYQGKRCQDLLISEWGQLQMIRLYLGEKGRTLTDEQVIELAATNTELLAQHAQMCGAQLEQIYKDLNWDVKTNPEGKDVDPKAYRAALVKVNLY